MKLNNRSELLDKLEQLKFAINSGFECGIDCESCDYGCEANDLLSDCINIAARRIVVEA